MSIPKITLTMLGASGSGKTLFLHGMYATLSAGIAGYFIYTRDPDDDIDIVRAWEILCDEGEPPPPNDIDGQQHYDFVFQHGIKPLLSIDCVDFRGGVIDGKKGSADDVDEISARLLVTDSIYLVLDGGHVADWILRIKDLGDDETVQLNRAAEPMKIARIARFVNDSAQARLARGMLAPSVVVLITKADLIPQITGMPENKALGIAAKHLNSLVPIVYAEGITALVSPVQIGKFGTDLHKPVDPADLDPIGLHLPFIFSLWHYLTESIQDGNERLGRMRAEQSSASAQLSDLRNGFLANFFHGAQIRDLESNVEQMGRRRSDLTEEISDSQSMVKQLMDQLGSLPILKDGKWQV